MTAADWMAYPPDPPEPPPPSEAEWLEVEDTPGRWENAAYPGWYAWRWAKRWYARKVRTSPPPIVRGQTLDELGEQIELDEAARQDRRAEER